MKSILITGCSSGIGLDSALAFRDAGWKVIASCRKPADCAMMRDHHKIHSICIDYDIELLSFVTLVLAGCGKGGLPRQGDDHF